MPMTVSSKKAEGRIVLAQVTPDDVDKSAKQIVDAVKSVVDAVEQKNSDGERAAREGAEKQREAERQWEGKARNYPQYER